MPSYRTIPRTCEVCGSGFLGRASIVKLGKARFCSEPCRNVGRSRPKPESSKVQRVALNCLRCGQGITRLPNVVASGRGRYCSDACKYAARRNREMVICETCGKAFERKQSELRWDRVYCSVPCRASAPPSPAILSDDGLTAQVPLQDVLGEIVGYTTIDAADVAWAQQWRWNLSPKGYVTRGGKDGTTYLHRELLGLVRGDGVFGDHINRDPLDNRRGNLRDATPSESPQNVPGRPGTSTHRGVSWHARICVWAAYLNVGGKRHHLGYFPFEEEAAEAARAAREQLMPFATD
jgi:hypothetical protein